MAKTSAYLSLTSNSHYMNVREVKTPPLPDCMFTNYLSKFDDAAEPVSPLQKFLSNSEALALLSLLESPDSTHHVDQQIPMDRRQRHNLLVHQNTHLFVDLGHAPPLIFRETRIEPFLVLLRNLRLVTLEIVNL